MTDTGLSKKPTADGETLLDTVEKLVSNCAGDTRPDNPRTNQFQLVTDSGGIPQRLDLLVVSDGGASRKWRTVLPDLSLDNAGLVATSHVQTRTFYAGDLNSTATINLGQTENCIIVAVSILSAVSTTGSNGGNNYSFRIGLAGTGLESAVLTSAAEITAGTPYFLFAGVENPAAEEDVLTLEVVKTGSPTALTAARAQVTVFFTPLSEAL